jgi:hypothetical protein
MLVCDIEYGGKGSRKATLSVWRTYVFHTDDGDELRVVQEIADEVCPILRHYFVFDFRHFFHRHSVTIKETLRIIRAYDFNCLTLLVKGLQRMWLEVEIEKYSCPRSNSVNTLLLRRTRSEGGERLPRILFPRGSKSAKDQELPQRGWLLMMKRSMLNKSGKQPSAYQMMTQTTSTHQ